MSIALFNDQQTLAGQKLGISTGKAIGLIIMASGLAAMNIYHMGNSITSKLLSPDSSIFAYALLYFIACCIAFMEVPVTEEIVTKEARGQTAKGYRLVLLVIVTMAIGAGLYSITSDADKRSTTVEAHHTNESTYDDRLNVLISERNIARANAKTTQERSEANADYYRKKAKLSQEKSSYQLTRPSLAIKTDSIFHWIWAIGFSLLCSIGVVVITAYLTKYHKPLTEIPRVFFKVKEEQNWTMNDDDVRVIPAQVDLAGGSSVNQARSAIKKSANPSPRPIQNAESNKCSEGTTDTRPHLEDTRTGAVSKGQNAGSVRTRNDAPECSVKNPYSSNHYDLIKQSVISGEIKPVIRPVKNKLIELKVTFINDAERQKQAIEILEKLKEEGALINNPDFGNTGKVEPKYLINTKSEEGISKPEKIIIEKPEKVNLRKQGSVKMIRTICPKCFEPQAISETNLKAWGGRCCCGECEAEYSVNDNLNKDQKGAK